VLRLAPALPARARLAGAGERYGRRIVDIERRRPHRSLRAAVDIGTSKIVVYFSTWPGGRQIDRSPGKPQMRFGEDVVTRITQAMMAVWRNWPAVRARASTCSAALYARQGILARNLYDMTVVGNTAMHHWLWHPPRRLGAARSLRPGRTLQLRAAEAGAGHEPGGRVHFLRGSRLCGSDACRVAAATARRPNPPKPLPAAGSAPRLRVHVQPQLGGAKLQRFVQGRRERGGTETVGGDARAGGA